MTLRELAKGYDGDVLIKAYENEKSKTPTAIMQSSVTDAIKDEILDREVYKQVEKENDNLRKQIEQLESFNAELDATVKEQTEMLNGGKLYEDYQEVCIKNSKLNATVDVLVEKISMLKAVGCHG